MKSGMKEQTNERAWEEEDGGEEEDLPLIDEINDLLIKERTLLGLKVVEQQIEAEEWKRKYEKLINKLSEHHHTLGGLPDVEIFEFVSNEIEQQQGGHRETIMNKNFDYYLQFHAAGSIEKQESHPFWCLNLSRIILQRLELKKLLNYPKSHSNYSIRVLELSHCEIQDKEADLIMLLFHYLRIQCLDLSFNELGTEFHAALIQSIEKKRLNLQYLLLEGNMSLSLLSLDKLVHHLSSHTWGLKVTLNDLENISQYENIETKQRRKMSKSKDLSAKTSFVSHIPELNLPPNVSYTLRLCARFLRHLNFVLGPDAEEDPKKSTTKSRHGLGNTEMEKRKTTTGITTTREGDKSNTINKVKNDLSEGFSDYVKKHHHRGPDKGEGGLQLLCVLGLTHAKFCKESLSQLQQTLELAAGSLTDLDLTYAFTGITGAEILADALRYRHCQLIRLGLTGNSFGDHGVEILAPSIKDTSTLTYLDLRSNDITNRGLASLTLAVMRHRTMCFLVIDGNPFNPDTAIESQIRIKLSGSQTQLKWTSSLGMVIDSPLRKEPSHCSSIFTIASQISIPIDPITRSVRLYSIPSHQIRPLSRQFRGDSQSYVNENDPSSEYILLKWIMGVSTLQSEDKDLFRRLSKTRLAWEIKCLTGTKTVSLAKRVLLPTALLPFGQRVQCESTIPCPPMYSHIEIWISVVSNDVKIGSRIHSTSVSRKNVIAYEVEGGLHIDSSHFEITRPNIYNHLAESFIFIPCDQQELSSVDNSLISLYDPYEGQQFHKFHHLPPSYVNGSIPEGFVIVRHFRWSGQPVGQGRIQFKLKLSTSHGFKRDSDDVSEGKRKEITLGRSKLIHEPTWNHSTGEEESQPKQGGGGGGADHFLGYEWLVMRCRHDGVGSHLLDNWYEIVGRGTHLDTTENLSNHPIETSILDPWLWKPYLVPVENILLNDGYILLYKISSSTGSYSTSTSTSNTMVSVSDWGVSVVAESYCGYEELLDQQMNGNILNAVWNDPSLDIAS